MHLFFPIAGLEFSKYQPFNITLLQLLDCSELTLLQSLITSFLFIILVSILWRENT